MAKGAPSQAALDHLEQAAADAAAASAVGTGGSTPEGASALARGLAIARIHASDGTGAAKVGPLASHRILQHGACLGNCPDPDPL